jgi:elongation factor Tu
LPEGVEMVMPGDNLTIDVVLLSAIIKCWFTFLSVKVVEQYAGQVTEIVA